MENFRVSSKTRPKSARFDSHGPANCSEATEVTKLVRRRGEREEAQRKKATFELPVSSGYFGFWTRKHYVKQGFLLWVRFRESGQKYIIYL